MGVSQPNQTLYVSNLDWGIKKPLLRRALYSLFTRHGKVLEIITLRKPGLKGQAWVIFDDTQAATTALQSEHGYNFFGKELKIDYARETSDRIAKKQGTFVAAKRRKKESSSTNTTTTTQEAVTVPTAPVPTAPVPTTTPQEKPSHILFAENLPSEVNQMMLEILFRPYTGFQEVRIPRPGLAFIEFKDEPHATLALEGLNGFKLTDKDQLTLKYGKS